MKVSHASLVKLANKQSNLRICLDIYIYIIYFDLIPLQILFYPSARGMASKHKSNMHNIVQLCILSSQRSTVRWYIVSRYMQFINARIGSGGTIIVLHSRFRTGSHLHPPHHHQLGANEDGVTRTD